MPLYEYQCLREGHRFEIRQPITSDPLHECPECGGEVRRIIHPVGIVFKGSGFYATDSRGKGVSTSNKAPDSSGESKSGTAGADKSGEGSSKSTSEAKTGDSKPKPKSEGSAAAKS